MHWHRRHLLAALLAAVAWPAAAQSMGMGLDISNSRAPSGGAPLDGFTQPTGAYSFRLLRQAYLGTGAAARLRRASDNAEIDIGFDGSGNFDTATATGHCAATSCFLRTWYDQSGLARHLENATTAAQPLLVFNCLGTLPCAYNNNIAVNLVGAAAVAPATGVVSLSAVSMRGIATGICHAIRQVSASRLSYRSGFNEVEAAGTGLISTPVATGGWNATSGVINGASSRLVNNGVVVTGTVTGSTIAAAPSIIGNTAVPCSWAEAVIWDNYVLTPAEQTALESNQRDYWLPAPLDTFTAPSGAYSFRKLKSTYSGPAVRIRRASDNAETDIDFLGFTSFTGAPWDSAAATAHCAATTCFGRTWYDQSGAARDLAQATAASQMQLIFDCGAGLPCFRTTTNTITFVGPSFTPATGVMSLSAVGRRAAGVSGCTLIRLNGVNARIAGFGGANQWTLVGGGGGSMLATATDNVWHASAGVVNGASSVLNIDDTEFTGTTAGNTTAGTIAIVGAAATTCDVSEAIAWDATLMSPAERAALVANQRSFWGTP